MKSSVSPSIRTRFCRMRSPATIDTARLGTPRASARTSISSALAASTGAAWSRTSSALPRVPAIPDRLARGMTRTSMIASLHGRSTRHPSLQLFAPVLHDHHAPLGVPRFHRDLGQMPTNRLPSGMMSSRLSCVGPPVRAVRFSSNDSGAPKPNLGAVIGARANCRAPARWRRWSRGPRSVMVIATRGTDISHRLAETAPRRSPCCPLQSSDRRSSVRRVRERTGSRGNPRRR